MAAVTAQQTRKEEDIETVQPKTVNTLTLLSLKRTYDLFIGNRYQKVPIDEDSQRAKIACKISDEYASVKDRAAPAPAQPRMDRNEQLLAPATEQPAEKEAKSVTAKLIDSIPVEKAAKASSNALVVAQQAPKSAIVPTAGGSTRNYVPSAQMSRRIASKWPRPVWHPPWKCYRVISGHLGWVRSVAFDPTNAWFATGSADRTIKFWDTASGQLKLTLTGHIEQVTGLGVSDRHPYLFSCALDKQVKCWDLEANRVIRQYHGHLSGIYSLALHPTLDLLMTGGRDSVCRVWDMRTKTQVFCLSGHHDNVCSILTQGTDPQVITGSHDHTIRLWDLRKGSTMSTLTYHKKSVRAMAMHPSEHAFASASAENIKKFALPEGEFLHNTLQQQRAIVNAMAINEDNVMITGGDNGSLCGNCFQQQETIAQPGSLESEAGIFAMSFDVTGTRLVTCEADKTIKMWREDPDATEETHPIVFKPPKDIRRF